MTDTIIPPAPEDRDNISAVVYPDLKALREAKGLSLKDIYETTRISVSNLSAIENGQFQLLPAPAFARTFIRNYALAIGAESEMLLAAYEKYLQSLNAPAGQEKETGGAWQKTGKYGKWIIWLLAALIAVIVIIILLSRDNRPSPEVAPAKSAAPAPTSPAPSVQTETAPAAPTPAAPETKPAVRPEVPKPASEKKYHISMEAREPVWIRIWGDGNQSEQMILQAGQTLERWADEPFTLDIGNAGGLEIIFRGKPVGSIGKRGQVVHLRFPED